MTVVETFLLVWFPIPSSALERELLGAVGVHGAPVGLIRGLAVVAGGVRLPGLVEGLEVEGVDAPVEGTAAVEYLLVDPLKSAISSRFTYTASW